MEKNVIYLDGQLRHFGFPGLLKCAQGFQTGMEAYFDANALKFQNKTSNFTSQRLVTELEFLTLLIYIYMVKY